MEEERSGVCGAELEREKSESPRWQPAEAKDNEEDEDKEEGESPI